MHICLAAFEKKINQDAWHLKLVIEVRPLSYATAKHAQHKSLQGSTARDTMLSL